MKLYSAWYCPFAQRTWMALIYKGLDFEYIEIDPYDLSDSWLELSRGEGLVPVLTLPDGRGGEATIIDSSRLLEFLDHNFPQSPALFSSNAIQRAEQKYWIDYINNKIVPFFYQYLKASEPGEQRDEKRALLVRGLSGFVQAMSSEGVYFSGKNISVIDFVLIPFAYRIKLLLEHYRNFKLPEDDALWLRYHDWFNAMLELPAYKVTADEQIQYAERIITHYQYYTVAGG